MPTIDDLPRNGEIDLERPVGLLQKKKDSLPGGDPQYEVILLHQQTPLQRQQVKTLQRAAVQNWWRAGHIGPQTPLSLCPLHPRASPAAANAQAPSNRRRLTDVLASLKNVPSLARSLPGVHVLLPFWLRLFSALVYPCWSPFTRKSSCRLYGIIGERSVIVDRHKQHHAFFIPSMLSPHGWLH